MKDEQFSELMGKLEEIRCGIIDVETAAENKPAHAYKVAPSTIREKFFAKLESKTGWGRNEIKSLFDESITECL